MGPALSQVKSQGFKKSGFDIGLLAGYQLNHKLSVETGIVYSKKYYFSNGKYFKTDKMPAGMKVMSLTGSSNVLEIPIAVKYEIAHTKATGLFVSWGISSYILTKENNNYITEVNGTQQNMIASYNKVSAGLVSSLHLGVGIEHSLGKKAIIRAEPYLNVPIKGMGVGSMQVTSAGIHFVATLPVH